MPAPHTLSSCVPAGCRGSGRNSGALGISRPPTAGGCGVTAGGPERLGTLRLLSRLMAHPNDTAMLCSRTSRCFPVDLIRVPPLSILDMNT